MAPLKLDLDGVDTGDSGAADTGADVSNLAASDLELLTDMDLAQRFENKHRGDLRHISEQERWIAHDGKRWRIDTDHRASKLARGLLEPLVKHAKAIRCRPGTVKSLGSAIRPDAMLKLAKGPLAVSINEIDSDENLLGTPSGILDLRTGQVTEGDRSRFVLKSLTVDPAPRADCPRWLETLRFAMAGDDDMVAYRQRQAGYFLVGNYREEVFFEEHGRGGNGRGTFFETLARILGTDRDTGYAVGIDRSLLVSFQGKDNQHPAAVAALAGKRLAVCSEFTIGDRLDVGMLTKLTGGDSIPARFMGGNFFNFVNVAKIVVCPNMLLRTPVVTGGFERRTRYGHWTQKAATADTGLKDYLYHKEASAILRWAIEGAALWRKHGLAPPARLRADTADYLRKADSFGQWLDERCDVEPAATAAQPSLRRSYEDFCTAQGYPPPSGQGFADELDRRGFQKFRSGAQGGDMRRGLRLKAYT